MQAKVEDGIVIDFEGQNKVEKEIWDWIHNKRFYLAEQVSICQGQLRGEFGFLVTNNNSK